MSARACSVHGMHENAVRSTRAIIFVTYTSRTDARLGKTWSRLLPKSLALAVRSEINLQAVVRNMGSEVANLQYTREKMVGRHGSPCVAMARAQELDEVDLTGPRRNLKMAVLEMLLRRVNQ